MRAFPRLAPSGRGSPASGGTTHALRLPAARHRRFVLLHARLMVPASAGSCPAPAGGSRPRRRPRPGLAIGHPVLGRSGTGRTKTAGSPRFPGNPSCLCRVRSPRRGGTPCQNGRPGSLPQSQQGKPAGSILTFEAHSHGFGTRRLRFPLRSRYTGKAGFRLPGRLCRPGFGFRLHPRVPFATFSCSAYFHWQPPVAPSFSWRDETLR